MARDKEPDLHILVVWEPILATDWKSPSSHNLARINDPRARQFWDPHHLVAGALNAIVKQNPPQLKPACCFDKGFYWDAAILYPAGARWENAPVSAFWNGPVYRIIPSLEKALNSSR